jgi:glutamate-ammonia-ligase adenylyltransferase
MNRSRNTTGQTAIGTLASKRAVLRDPTPLLLAPGLDPKEVQAILSSYGLRSCEEADRNIQAMAGEPHERRQLAMILPDLLRSTAGTADPDQALNHWERLFSGGVTRISLLDYLHASPRMLNLLCTIFGNSDALAFTLIRDPMLIHWLAEEDVLSNPPSRSGMERALRGSLDHLTVTELKLEALRRFRRREMLKIGVRDLFRLATVEETTASLSDLAAVLIQVSYEIVDSELRAEYGVPMHRNRDGRWVETGFAVIGMGKLGGHELNYSSDVDLIYVYESAEGQTRPAGQAVQNKASRSVDTISNEEYFELLARRLTKVLSESTKEGYLFRVDLRLRAEGSVGQLARSLDQYAKYYRTRGRIWERLALLKSWPVAGSAVVGRAFVRMVKRFVWEPASGGLDLGTALGIIREVRAVKEMIDEKIADRGHERRNVKLGIGGIREIEFLAQTVQVIGGGGLPGIVARNTLEALDRFHRHRLLSERDVRRLTEAYRFLRDVEHKLQMVHELQTHSLPHDEAQLAQCAIRMGYGAVDRQASLARFRADHARHTGHVNRTFRSFFYAPERSALLKAALCANPRSQPSSGAARKTKSPVALPPGSSSFF